MKFFRSILVVLTLSLAAMAQPYSTNRFTAVFNGPVAVDTYSNPTNTNARYISSTNDVAQSVTVRIVDHDIAVDYTSSDYYVENQTGCESKNFLSKGTWQGNPFSYDFCTYTNATGTWTTRTRFIIVNSREVIFIQQSSLASYDDMAEWSSFEATLEIR